MGFGILNSQQNLAVISRPGVKPKMLKKMTLCHYARNLSLIHYEWKDKIVLNSEINQGKNWLRSLLFEKMTLFTIGPIQLTCKLFLHYKIYTVHSVLNDYYRVKIWLPKTDQT